MAPTPPRAGVPPRSQNDSRMNHPAQSFQPVASARIANTASGLAADVASAENEYSVISNAESSRMRQQRKDETVEDVSLAHQALVEIEVAHDGYEDGGASDDDVGPRLLEPGVVDAIGPLLGRERAEHILGGLVGQDEVVDALGVVLGEPLLDGGHRRHRARQANEALGFEGGGHLPRDVLEVVLRHRDDLAELLGGGRIVLDELLGE